MSKIKKIISSVIIVMLMLLLVQNSVQADETRKYFSYTDLCRDETLLCAQHHQSMFGDSYKLIATVDINGNDSTGNGVTVEDNWHNANLASILSNARGQGDYGGTDVEWLDVQNAVWNCLPGWINSVGTKHGIPSSFGTGSTGNYVPDLQKIAKTYADNYKETTLTDKTNKDKLSAESYKENNEVYLRVGPLKYEFSGILSGIKVSTDKNENVGITKIEKKVSIDKYQKYSNIEGVKSGDEFYVSIKVPSDGSEAIKSVTITNKTKQKHVKVKFWESESHYQQNLIQYEYDENEREIPFKFDYNLKIFGHFKVIKIDEKNNVVKLPNVTFYIKNKNIDCYVKQSDNGNISYVSNKNEAKLFKTDENGEISIRNLIPGTYVAYEENNPNYGYIISKDGKEKNVVIDKTAELKIPNKKAVGNLKVIKVDAKNNEVKLAGVGFYVKNEDTNKYVKVEANQVKYVDNKEDATEFITNKNGEFEVKDLIVGTYKAYETKNPNYGYEIIKDGIQKEVTIDKTEELQIPNNPKYIKISGYVWKDNQSGKQSIRNDLFKDNDYDDKDELLKDIVVRLKYKGNVIATTKTNSNGAYLFKNVEIDKLADYSIEFEYNGLTYENVVPHLDKDNGSKAIEGQARTTFNNKFSEITKDTKIDNTTLEYSYKDHKSTLTNGDKFNINSTTVEAGLNIEDKYTPGMEEIKNLNLGLYEREQPDLAVVKDIDNVRITVNGYEHMYKYESRFVNAGEYSDGFNVGVKFGTKYGTQTYSRAIYKSDYDYKNDGDKSKELKAYITYKIALKNESTSLTSRVNSLVDYYDSKYKLVAVGTDVGKDGNITGTAITHTDDTYNDNYKKTTLNTIITINPESEEYIYVQFSMDKETIGSIMFDVNGEEIKEKLLLDNVVEINSYSTYKDNVLYAGVDKDSRPGNAIPGNRDTYEDDTDAAPALALELADARKITGTVFLDSTTEELKVGEERVGDGIYTNGERTIPGVTVRLVKEDGSVEKTSTTDENGYFELSGFMPGNYTIVYTWGDAEYTVDDYKGTIYKDLERLGRRLWYTENMDTRYSDAIDNYETRKLIDSGEHPEITTMDSSTPAMKLGIEMTDQNTGRVLDITPGIDKVEFLIRNVDFGIVERPRQKLDISKEVTAIKVTAGNTEIVNAKIGKDSNGKWEAHGTATQALTLVQPQLSTEKPLLWGIVDTELMSASTVQIEYTITVANNSELDYDSERYYKYGIKEGNKVVVKPEGVYDYLDKEMALDSDKEAENNGWVTITTAEYTNIINTEPTIVDEYISRYSSISEDSNGYKIAISGFNKLIEEYSEEITETTKSTLSKLRQKMAADKTILYNANLEKELEAGESNSVKLYTSKKLAASDEIDLNNNVEITKVKRNTETGRKVTPRTSKLLDYAEEVVITPPTGENQDYVLPIVLGVSLLIILGAGIILIKKKVLNK